MGRIKIFINYKPQYFDQHEVIALQTAGKHNTTYFFIAPGHPNGYDRKLPCGHLKEHEENVKQYAQFMRVCRNTIVNLQHVRGLGEENLITFKLAFFKEEIYLDTNLRDEFKRRMEQLTLQLLQISLWAEGFSALAA